MLAYIHLAQRLNCDCHHVCSFVDVAPTRSTLFSTQHKYKGGHDPFDVSSVAFGEQKIHMVNRQDQSNCGRRGCENYDDTQMWWFDPVDKLLRLSTYVPHSCKLCLNQP